MRILDAKQHRKLDAATMEAHGIGSLELMERAASALTDHLLLLLPDDRAVTIIAGPGNNGGDGLVVARLLKERGFEPSVQVIRAAIADPSDDHLSNLLRVHDAGIPVRVIERDASFPGIDAGTVVIDALFGTGLSRPIKGYWADFVDYLNDLRVVRIAVDLPSGLPASGPVTGAAVRAHYTLSLGYPKPTLFAPSSTEYLGEWTLVEFPLDRSFVESMADDEAPTLLTYDMVASYLRPRRNNDHKGTFGHALLVAGKFGTMGAAVISARAILRAGAGLVTVHLPRAGYEIMQIAFPEAMCAVDPHRYHTTEVNLERGYEVVAVGPGLGTEAATARVVEKLLDWTKRPMVLDADALNILAKQPDLLKKLPKDSILTPHPGEFRRLFGESDNDFERWERQRRVAHELGVIVVLKTGFTTVACPDGRFFINPTGNPGMGTAGTGDALTGVLTGLLAQGYEASVAARLGVFLHGLAGDIAADELEQESLLAEDVVSHLGRAFKKLHTFAAPIKHPA